MLDAITDRLHWRCFGGEEDEYCGASCEAGIDEAVYRLPRSGGRRGAVIDLPYCACGARCSLKADYTLKELWKAVQPVQNEAGVIWAYALPLRFVRNVRLHWMLYERGMAEFAPVLPLPDPEMLTHLQMMELSDTDCAHAVWFGMLMARDRGLLPIKEQSVVALIGAGGNHADQRATTRID